jgi:flagellum-specific peptidoglycan hydrolase FlgJ
MATPEQLAVLSKYYDAARFSEHIFPDWAACEAVLESAWGTSELAADYNNVFGQKVPKDGPPPGLLQVLMPTREFVKGGWIDIKAQFLWFPHLSMAFTQRMRLLQSDSSYAPALHAETGEEFVTLVSKVWATDPNRATHVIAIHNAHQDVFQIHAG